MRLDPANLTIQHYPAEALRRPGLPVEEIDGEVRAVAARMVELMREDEGIGLAAPQVGLPWRLFVVEIPESDGRSASADPPTATRGAIIYINPTLSQPAGELLAAEEGCLSLPDIRGEVLRPSMITITATDLEGRTFSQTGAGLLARCWQHEYDHLDGVLIIDRMTPMSRLKNRAAVRDLERLAQRM